MSALLLARGLFLRPGTACHSIRLVGHLTREPSSISDPRCLHSDAAGARHEDASTSSASAVHAAQDAQQGSRSGQDRLLMRDFIYQSLYHPTRGYFNKSTPVVGSLAQPIDYWKLATGAEWQKLMAQKYKELGTAWLTPVEIFSPWYGSILARHIMEHRRHNLGQEDKPLEIIEIGGGSGTLARDVLNWLRENVPHEYAKASYTCMEISPRLAGEQYDKVVAKAGHGGRFRVIRADASKRESWGPEPNYTHTFILMMEVLDNLSHDKVFRESEGAPWMQSVVRLDNSRLSTNSDGQLPGMEDGPWVEEWEPVTDPLIQRALPAVYRKLTFDERMDEKINRMLDWVLAKRAEPGTQGPSETLWLPTACLALLDILHSARPNHSLIAADFDQLPGAQVPGRYAPLVSEKVGGESRDYDTVFVPWGTADIFFPTDFDALSRLYLASAEHVWKDAPKSAAGRLAYAHYQQGEVMRRYKEMMKTATLFSFNPMVNDFTNARFFLGDSYGRKAVETVTASTTRATTILPTDSQAAEEWPLPAYASSSQPAQNAAKPPAQHNSQQSETDRKQSETDAPVPPLEFSWQWGYGKGVKHAMASTASAGKGKAKAGGAKVAQSTSQAASGAGKEAHGKPRSSLFTLPAGLPPVQPGRSTELRPGWDRQGGSVGSIGGRKGSGAGSNTDVAVPWGAGLAGKRPQQHSQQQQQKGTQIGRLGSDSDRGSSRSGIESNDGSAGAGSGGVAQNSGAWNGAEMPALASVGSAGHGSSSGSSSDLGRAGSDSNIGTDSTVRGSRTTDSGSESDRRGNQR